MKFLIVYATTEGQTRKIARFVAERLTAAGHSTELLGAADADGVDPGQFDGAVLAGSIHAGAYQPPLIEFAAAHAATLSGMKTLFLSVSLSAAGDDPEERAGIDKCAADFFGRTGWRHARLAHVAGAFRFSEYDFFRNMAMRLIARQKGEMTPRGDDREYTDWAALGVLIDAWGPLAGRA